MNYENWISYRYLIASKGRFLTFLNIISIVGVALGVMALIIVIGVMTGFGNNLREKIIGTTPHVMIEKEVGIRDFEEVRQSVNSIEGVKGSSAYIQGSTFLEDSSQALGLIVRGINIDEENRVTKVDSYVVDGSIESIKDNGIIIGSELARYFGFSLGDEVTLLTPSRGLAGEGWRNVFKVGGIFTTGVSDYDTSLVIIDLANAQSMFNMPPDMVTGIGVKLNDPQKASDLKKRIYEKIGYSFIVKTWIDNNKNLFEALFLEKLGLYVVLTLMVLVASFNIISTLIVTVSSKVHDIGILQSIGVPKKSIKKIFTKQGIFVGMLGTLFGVIGGISMCYLLQTYVEVPREIYSIDRVPVDIEMIDMAVIVFSAMLISYLATIYPASKASRLQPVEALRYE